MPGVSTSLHYSIGKSKRKDLNDSAMIKIVPGPGAYNHQRFQTVIKS